MSYYHHLIKAGASYGALTTAWISATGETDVTILGALNTLESGLITNTLIAKTPVLYLMAGGTADKCKRNFMNSANGAPYEAQFSGGLTITSNGVLPNGTNGKATTGYTPPSGNAGMFFYSRTNNANFNCSIGAYNSVSSSQSILFLQSTGASASMNSSTFAYSFPTNTNSLGFFGVIRVGGDVITNANGVVLSETKTQANTSIPLNLFNRGGSDDLYSDKQCAGAGFIENYTSSELTILKDLINTFNTTLSRNV